ncbi:MAG: hypothetical protein GY866_09175 [Proteobacteria bacterium]|nr:hypothetical protein [Pseudomonadota bacterium]
MSDLANDAIVKTFKTWQVRAVGRFLGVSEWSNDRPKGGDSMPKWKRIGFAVTFVVGVLVLFGVQRHANNNRKQQLYELAKKAGYLEGKSKGCEEKVRLLEEQSRLDEKIIRLLEEHNDLLKKTCPSRGEEAGASPVITDISSIIF